MFSDSVTSSMCDMRDEDNRGSSSSSSSSTRAESRGATPTKVCTLSDVRTASALRLTRDLDELAASKFTAAQTSTRITFPTGKTNARRVCVLLTPHTGLYAGASFELTLYIPLQYPFRPPKVRCHTPVIHPNIDWRTGKLFLHLIETQWKPVLALNTVLFALQLMFLEPWPVAPTTTTSVDVTPAVEMCAPGGGGSIARVSAKSVSESRFDQLSDDAVLNAEIRSILGSEHGKRHFESLVQKTRRGGFFFGMQWAPNPTSAANEDSDALPAQCTQPTTDNTDKERRVRIVRSETGNWMVRSPTSECSASLAAVSASSARVHFAATRWLATSATARPFASAVLGASFHRRLHSKRDHVCMSNQTVHAYNPASLAEGIDRRSVDDNRLLALETDSSADAVVQIIKKRTRFPVRGSFGEYVACSLSNRRVIHIRRVDGARVSNANTEAASSSSSSSNQTHARMGHESHHRNKRRPSSPYPRDDDDAVSCNLESAYEPGAASAVGAPLTKQSVRHFKKTLHTLVCAKRLFSGIDHVASAGPPPARMLFTANPRSASCGMIRPSPQYGGAPAHGLTNLRDLLASLP